MTFGLSSPPPAVLAAAWAAAAVLGVRAGADADVGLPVVAGIVVLTVAVVVRTRRPSARCLPALAAIPAALAAWHAPEPTSSPSAPRSSTVVHVDGIVVPPVALDADRAGTTFDVRTGGRTWRCTCRGTLDVLPGDRVVGHALATPHRDARTGRATARLVTRPGALSIVARSPAPGRFGTAVARRLGRVLREHVPGEGGRLLSWLVLGRGPWLDEATTRAHRDTGLTHLLAVSGAHASMLAWLLGLAFAAVSGQAPFTSVSYRRTCATLLVAYGAITGFQPPVVRALVAHGYVLWAQANGRRPRFGSALALPALLTAWIAPDDLFSVSFCLSYAAVCGLALAGAFDRFGQDPRSWLQAGLRASAWAVLTTAPFTLWWFGQLAPWTVLATPFLAPLVAGLLALGLAVALTGCVLPPVAAALALPLAPLTDAYLTAVDLVALLPWTPVHAPQRAAAGVLVAAACFGVAILAWRPDRLGVAIFCAALSAPHFLPVPTRPSDPRLELLDVGHGQAALAELRDGTVLLVDCGSQGRGRRASRAVATALARRRTIDWLIVSHGDADHVGGIPDLAHRLPIRNAILPHALRGSAADRALAAAGTRREWLRAGERLRVRPDLVVEAPRLRHGATSRNDRSLWTEVDVGTVRVLLPGDAESAAIRAVLRARAAGDRGRVDVLVLPHHGRGMPTDARTLVDALRPQLAVVSAARSDVVPDLVVATRRCGIPVASTADHGTIALRPSTAGVRWSGSR